MKSWKPEVIADNIGHWAGNAVRLATKAEAERYVADLMYRWTSVRETRVVECDDPVTHAWTEHGLVRIIEGEMS